MFRRDRFQKAVHILSHLLPGHSECRTFPTVLPESHNSGHYLLRSEAFFMILDGLSLKNGISAVVSDTSCSLIKGTSRVTRKVVPSWSLLVASMVPFIWSTIFFTIARPRPLPVLYSLLYQLLWKTENTFLS